jgi:hypothetical protein
MRRIMGLFGFGKAAVPPTALSRDIVARYQRLRPIRLRLNGTKTRTCKASCRQGRNNPTLQLWERQDVQELLRKTPGRNQGIDYLFPRI